MADTAKVFWSGRSQAVRLPKEYRFATDTVTIRRDGTSIVLDPVSAELDAPNPDPKMQRFLNILRDLGPPDEDFVEAALDRPKVDTRPDPSFD